MLASFLELFRGKRGLYIFSCLLLVSSLPFSLIGLSWAQFLLIFHWLSEKNYREKLQRVWQNKATLLLIGLFLVHLIGLLYTEDFVYGFKDVRVKLPMLTLPFLLASQPAFSKRESKWILLFFNLAVLLATFITFFGVEIFELVPVGEARDLSFFISHIRFSLMIVLSTFSLFWLVFKQNQRPWAWVLLSVVSSWYVFYLLKLEALSGLVIGLVLLVFSALYFTYYKRKRFLAVTGVLIAFIAVAVGFLFTEVSHYFSLRETNKIAYKTHSVGGELYEFRDEVQQYENGFKVWAFLATKELKSGWSKRSDIGYFEEDAKGQPLYATLIRYMTSKGLTKDSVGLQALSAADIEAIESGITNVNQLQGRSIQNRLHELIWEIEAYWKGYNPSGNSFTQRLEYWKTAWHIIRNNSWLGVGTGDVKAAFEKQYVQDGSPLKAEYRKRSHNQYLSFFVGMGLVGIGYYLLLLLAPFFIQRPTWYLFWIFYLLMLMCMLTEDTYERQIGATFISFFFAFFWFGSTQSKEGSN